jgi:hypothetical protein
LRERHKRGGEDRRGDQCFKQRKTAGIAKGVTAHAGAARKVTARKKPAEISDWAMQPHRELQFLGRRREREASVFARVEVRARYRTQPAGTPALRPSS